MAIRCVYRRVECLARFGGRSNFLYDIIHVIGLWKYCSSTIASPMVRNRTNLVTNSSSSFDSQIVSANQTPRRLKTLRSWARRNSECQCFRAIYCKHHFRPVLKNTGSSPHVFSSIKQIPKLGSLIFRISQNCWWEKTFFCPCFPRTSTTA